MIGQRRRRLRRGWPFISTAFARLAPKMRRTTACTYLSSSIWKNNYFHTSTLAPIQILNDNCADHHMTRSGDKSGQHLFSLLIYYIIHVLPSVLALDRWNAHSLRMSNKIRATKNIHGTKFKAISLYRIAIYSYYRLL